MKTKDPLTRLYNRQYMQERLRRDIESAGRSQQGLALALVDIDGLRSINQQHGHITGDKVLKRFARLLEDSVRRSDWVGRIGGDEFAIVLSNTPLSDAFVVVEQVRADCQAAVIETRNARSKVTAIFRVTASFGITALMPRPGHTETLDTLLHKANAALHLAKRAGGNCVQQMIDEFPE